MKRGSNMRLSWIISILVSLAILQPVPVLASSGLLFGEQQQYSVTFRGNGESVVTARLVLTNHTDADQKTFQFELPGLNVSEVVGYQQISTAINCRYPATPLNGSAELQKPSIAPDCLASDEPDYLRSPAYYGSSYKTNYEKLKFKVEGQKYQTDLPVALAAGKSTALLLSYAGIGYAKAGWGGYDIRFQTIKVNERVTEATVAVDVDSDLYLEGAASRVTYASGTGKSEAAISSSAGMSRATSAQLDSIAANVGQGGGFTKIAKDLAPGDTYTVKGRYADALWKLHLGRLAVLAGVVVLVVALVVVLLRRYRRRTAIRPAGKTAATADLAPAPAAPAALDWHTVVSPVYVITGLASALMTGLITWALTAYSGQAYSANYDAFTGILVALVGILAYALAVLGPVVWLAARAHSWKIAVVAFAWIVVWLFILLLVYVLALRPLLPGGSDGGVIMPAAADGAAQ